jgi:hypothetical protein
MIRVKKADLLTVAHYLIGHLSCSQVPVLAKRHKVEAKINSASAQELLVKKVGTYPLPSRSRGDLVKKVGTYPFTVPFPWRSATQSPRNLRLEPLSDRWFEGFILSFTRKWANDSPS